MRTRPASLAVPLLSCVTLLEKWLGKNFLKNLFFPWKHASFFKSPYVFHSKFFKNIFNRPCMFSH